jgi:NADPH:quinone reductase-like Zn-dependent oxidoreductase
VKAIQVSRFGAPEVLQVADVDEPHAGPGQIRVAVRAASVNPVDWKIRSGAMQQFIPVQLPYVPGSDVAGVVDEVGRGVSGVAVGDEVFGFAVGGGYAQYAVLEHFAAKPTTMGWAEAAGLPVAAETAVRALDLLGVSAGQTLLINGAAGGVGAAAVQFARARDVMVIGTAGPANHDFLRRFAATPTAYGAGLVERVRALAPSGVDRAFDAAGRGALPELIELTGSPQRVLTIADPQAQQYGVLFTSGSGQRS